MFERRQPEADFARRAVVEAAGLCRQVQREMAVEELQKSDRSPVTVADFGAQALVASRLADRFPNDPLVAEEDSAALRRSEGTRLRMTVARHVRHRRPEATEAQVLDWIDRGQGAIADRFWTLDPIDGTAGFLRGDQWVVAMALIEGGEVSVGALALPGLDSTLSPRPDGEGSVIVAVGGQGAWVDRIGGSEPRRLAVSDRRQAANARVMGSVEPAHTDVEGMARLRRRLATTEPLVKMDSQAKYAVLAGGGAELILRLLSPERPDYREKIWDQAAGALIVHEAGGRVTDLWGRPLDFSTGSRLTANRGVVASNGWIHEQVLAAVRAESAHLPPAGR